jgi:CheY-like chemotaxis protein
MPVAVCVRRGAEVFAQVRILVVDDHPVNLEIFSKTVRQWGAHAECTTSPEEALEWLRRGDPFDVGFLDHQMPLMDGITLASEIRRAGFAFPLVLFTSLGVPDRTDLKGVEFAGLLTKPIKQSQLFDRLQTIFAFRRKLADTARAKPSDTRPPASDLSVELPRKILIAEDNPVNQKVIVLLLKSLGYRADVVADGVEVLTALERTTYDVILMDVQMPELDGREATRRIRKQEDIGGQPYIIALTADALDGDRERCIAAGMDDYLSKPLDRRDLINALRRSKKPSQ